MLARAAFLGAVTGAASAAAILHLPLGLGDVPGFHLAGRCVGTTMTGDCSGLGAEIYIYPGLFFGSAFAALLSSPRGRLGAAGATAFVILATASNAVAVWVWTIVVDPLGSLLAAGSATDFVFAVTGAIAGGIGGGLLGYGGVRLLRVEGWSRLMAAGAALGLLVPFAIDSEAGFFAFYIVWQGGYAATLADTMRRARLVAPNV